METSSPLQASLDFAEKGRLSIIDDIRLNVLSRGWLTKDEIKATWGLDEIAYAALKQELAEEKLIVSGPKGVGGFEAKFRRRPLPPEEEAAFQALFRTDWENSGAFRLAELLNYSELEKLLGELVYTVRRVRMLQTGEDRRGTKTELAAALIIQHGVDLFADRAIREIVAKKCKANCPHRWHPGKSTALKFVAEIHFPREFAGIPSDEAAPDFEYLEGRVDLKPLRDFQLEVQKKLLTTLNRPGGKAIVTLPTGAGKTRVAVDSVRDWLTERWAQLPTGAGNAVLWLAHTEELCEQAYSCFREVWQASSNVSPLLLFRFWGRYTQDLIYHRETLLAMETRPTVLVSTPQRIVNLLDGKTRGAADVVEDLERNVGLILVDEAHRAAAPSYRRIIHGFSKVNRNVLLIGLTATPFRGEYDLDDPLAGTRELKELFGTIIEPIKTLGDDPRPPLQQEGYLAVPEWSAIKTDTLLKAPEVGNASELTVEDIERIDYALKIRADNPKRRLAILDRVCELASDPNNQILYFGPSVLDAECMAFMLRQRGISAVFISGNTRDVTRRKVISDFKSGAARVLCNCEVLTTGFDAPKVSHVIMARPTVSQVLYEQMIGRGLRGPKFGGTSTCQIIDLEDNYRSDRPKLGYRVFRELWLSKTKRRARL